MAADGFRRNCYFAIMGGCISTMCLSALFLALLHAGPRTILWVCNDSELTVRCKPINLAFKGEAGKKCVWFHYRSDQEKPCCYAERKLALYDVCSSHSTSPRDQENCRGGSRSKHTKPKVEFDGESCTLSIEDPDAQDVGYYEGSMPHDSKDLGRIVSFREYVDSDQVCDFTIQSSCKERFGASLIFVSAFILLFTLLATCRKNILATKLIDTKNNVSTKLAPELTKGLKEGLVSPSR